MRRQPMLSELSIRNFKSWQEIRNMRFAPITGLFGTNSSGKTSILQFLLMLKQTVDSTDFSQVLNFGEEGNLVALGTFGDVVHGRQQSSVISWAMKWLLPDQLKIIVHREEASKTYIEGHEMEFSAEVESNTGGKLRVNYLRYKLGEDEFGMQHKLDTLANYKLSAKSDKLKLIRSPGRPWPLPSPTKHYGFPYEVRAHYQNVGFLWRLQFVYESMFQHIYYLRPLRENPRPQYTWAGAKPDDVGQRGEKAIDALLSSGKTKIPRGRGRPRLTLEEYVADWLKQLGLIHEFHVKRITEHSNLYEVWVQKNPEGASVRITDVGFGLSQILPVLVLCYYVPEGSIVLLEQPEIHLHPSAQSGLADVFIDAIKTRKIQIILESHSEHLLKRLQRRIAEAEYSKDDIALYFCDIKHGVSQLIPLELNIFGSITNWPKDFFGDSFGEIAATSMAAIKRKKEQV
jgi:predicted ATPase